MSFERDDEEEQELQEYIKGLTDQNNALLDRVMKLEDDLLRSEELLASAIAEIEEVCSCGHHRLAHYRMRQSPCVKCKCNKYERQARVI